MIKNETANLLWDTFAHWLEHILRRTSRGPERGLGSLPAVELSLAEHAPGAKYAKFAKCLKIVMHVAS